MCLYARFVSLSGEPLACMSSCQRLAHELRGSVRKLTRALALSSRAPLSNLNNSCPVASVWLPTDPDTAPALGFEETLTKLADTNCCLCGFADGVIE